MKKFKIVSNIMAIIAISLFMLSILISVITNTGLDGTFMTLIEINIILIACAALGVFLMFTKNDVARKLGNGMTVVGFLTGLICAVSVLVDMDSKNADTPIGAVIMIVSVVLLLLHYAFLLVDYLLNRNAAKMDPSEDKRVARIKEWKALMEEGIITEEEYEEKRVQLLGIKPKENKE